MFTGLVEAVGRVSAVVPEEAGIRLKIEAPASLTESDRDRCRLGDSIAINGCCLTVVDVASATANAGEHWTFQAGSETLSKTNLGALQAGSTVNLERSLPAGGRLGGHFVQGHVDGVGRVESIDREGEWVFMAFAVPLELSRFLAPKGSIAVDGVSLTVVSTKPGWFNVALIPHTLSQTTLGLRTVGDVVNVETDMLAKYVDALLAARGIGSTPA